MLPSQLYSVLSLFTYRVKITDPGTFLTQSSPLDAQWASLNRTVGGRLKAATPFSQPCFSQHGAPNDTACLELQSHNEDHCELHKIRLITILLCFSFFTFESMQYFDRVTLAPTRLPTGRCAKLLELSAY